MPDDTTTQTTATAAQRTKPTPISSALAALLLGLCLALSLQHVQKPAQEQPEPAAEPGWSVMPAGARSAYLGIHGGTLPVSLLVSSTEPSLVSFVGQTGNDFLALLRKAELRLPSFLRNGTEPKDGDILGRTTQEHIMAGSPTTSMPVVSLSGDSVFSLAERPDAFRPFGLSEKPLGIEGRVAMPDPKSQQPRYHLLVEPKHLKPR